MADIVFSIVTREPSDELPTVPIGALVHGVVGPAGTPLTNRTLLLRTGDGWVDLRAPANTWPAGPAQGKILGRLKIQMVAGQ